MSRTNDVTTGSETYLERQVRERAHHSTDEEIRTTCSFARAERLLGREYHGRFLIELLQNAADAWRNDPRSVAGERSRVAVLVTEGPALLVANQGAPMTAEVVIESLGHIGATTKAEGQAIGHKGIGFKSVLEVTLVPEIYSGLQEEPPGLAVKFDPELAHSVIAQASPTWADVVTGIQGLDPNDELAPIPVLRFPFAVRDFPSEVEEFAAEGFDTVVRLPFDSRFADRLRLDEAAWLTRVRDTFRDVSDQILVLLGCFSEARLEDRLTGHTDVVTPSWDGRHSTGDREVIQIFRNGELSSGWRLFRRTLPQVEHLAGEIAVGVRLDGPADQAVVLPAIDDEASARFHLFFPTRIASGLPFLLHGYFEVDAARTGFYQGSASRNRAILRELSALAADAVRDAVANGDTDLVSLVEIIARAGEPEDPLARGFRASVLDHLDEVAWIPVHRAGDGPKSGRPSDLFVTGLNEQIAQVFPERYVESRVGLMLPDTNLTGEALALARVRQADDQPDQWKILASLCRPGTTPIWLGADADEGFIHLLDLLTALAVEDSEATTAFISGLRGDPESRLLPTVGDDGERVLLPVPDPSEGVSGHRGRLVMARARWTSDQTLVPPDQLDLAFLPEGLLGSEADIDRAKQLGVRPFTVDNVLDRLNGITDSDVDHEALLTFLWSLLHRERQTGFGTGRSAERASVFDPREWFWCHPGRAREYDNPRDRQQRERYLASVPVPCRDGIWRAAGAAGFGADWADWLESGVVGKPSSASVQRATAYRALEAVSPGPHALIASPTVIAPYLVAGSFANPSPDDGNEPQESIDEHQRNAERHAFLLRLGVWEVPPLEAFESRDARERSNFPWTGSIADRQQVEGGLPGGWKFGLEGWQGKQHKNVYLAEDYRFAWPLEEMAERDPSSLSQGLQLGAELYGARLRALYFCPRCSDSGGGHSAARYSNAADGYPSSLALQLRHDRWATCTLDGRNLERPQQPASVWWHPKPPSGAGLRQSPFRLLPLCGPSTGMSEELRQLAEVNRPEDAGPGRLRTLLLHLRSDFELETLPVDPSVPGTARQAFLGLHRLVYDRLAEISSESPDEVTLVLTETGVLCELGEGLVYRGPAEAFHDDGRFAAYVRHFVGEVPFVALARDRDVTASALGVRPFVVLLSRRGEDEGRDVTDELRSVLGDRIAELLSIVVNHSLGTQTLEPTSQQFEERMRRLQALTVRQVDDLVIDASIEGVSFTVTIGEGADQDLYLEAPTSPQPVLFHDLIGEGWQDRLRRKIAPHLASLIDNPSYTATFALFLQLESDAEREEFLLELGISTEEVDAVATRIGISDEEEQRRHLIWYTAVLRCLGMDGSDVSLDPGALTMALSDAGIDQGVASRLVEIGGSEGVRKDTSDGSSLRILVDAGVDLEVLDSELRELGDPGLSIAVARRRLARWLDVHGRRCVVALAKRDIPHDAAKTSVRGIEARDDLDLMIDPPLEEVLEPVAQLLRARGLDVTAGALAADPVGGLVEAAGFASGDELDAQIPALYDEEEQGRVLREHAAQWRRELRLMAVLARMGSSETRATIRAADEVVDSVLPTNPLRPTELIDPTTELFIAHPGIADEFIPRLSDSVMSAVSERGDLLEVLAARGVMIHLLGKVELALEAPRRHQARETKARAQRLAEGGVVPSTPAGLRSAQPKEKSSTRDRKKVASVKVEESHDRRKRELGNEGEQWALAAVIGRLLEAGAGKRDAAVGEVLELLEGFEGTPVEAARSHAELARSRDLDDDELIDELTGLLHVSRHSDAFGFDLIGWLPPTDGAQPQAMCLEVKASSGEGFYLSRGEWSLAQRFHSGEDGDRYAVLVVRQGRRGGVPISMDLLVDPVALVDGGQLRQDVDGYQIAYRSSRPPSSASTN